VSYQSANNAETEVETETQSGLDIVFWLQTEIQPVLDRANCVGESVVNHDILSGETWIVCEEHSHGFAGIDPNDDNLAVPSGNSVSD